MMNRNGVYLAVLGMFLILAGCSAGDSSAPGASAVSTNFPYLKSVPQVTYIKNVNDVTKYDVTVSLEADGPNGVYAVGLWLYDKNNTSNFAYMDLQYMGGTTWSATTNTWIPLASGNYYMDSILIEDGDPFLNGIVKDGWYTSDLMSNAYYAIDQRETDWNTPEILNYNFGISNIPIVNFTLP